MITQKSETPVILKDWEKLETSLRIVQEREAPQYNPDFINKIKANDLIWVHLLAVFTRNNFTKIGWVNEREGNSKKKKTHVYVD